MTEKVAKPVAKVAKPAAKAAKTAPVKSSRQPAAKASDIAATKAPAKKAASSVAKPLKEKKVKVVRDSFTIPKNELNNLAEMKKRALSLGLEVKKSELIRAGLLSLSSLNNAAFQKAIAGVPIIKTGRPAKG